MIQQEASNSIMFTVNDLITAFDHDLLFAWNLLHAEIFHEAYPARTQHIKTLVSLYSTALQKFNSHHLPCQHHFKVKINQLMAQPKVITCLHSNKISQKDENNPSLQNIAIPQLPNRYSLQQRKQDLQLRVAYDVEQTKNVRLGQIIRQQKQKVKRIQAVVKNQINNQELNLKNKIQRRQSRASATRKLRYSLQSCPSTTVEVGQNDYDHLGASFADIPFIQQ